MYARLPDSGTAYARAHHKHIAHRSIRQRVAMLPHTKNRGPITPLRLRFFAGSVKVLTLKFFICAKLWFIECLLSMEKQRLKTNALWQTLQLRIYS